MDAKQRQAQKTLKDEALGAEEFCREAHAITGEKSLIDPSYELGDRYTLARELLLKIALDKNAGLPQVAGILFLPSLFISPEKDSSTSLVATESTELADKSGGIVPESAAELPNYYQLLDVQPNATRDEIRSAYRKIIKEIHPDVIESKNLSPKERSELYEKTLQVNDAYAVLSNKKARKEYNNIIFRKRPPKTLGEEGLLITLTPTKDKAAPSADAQEFKNRAEAAGSLTEKDAKDIAESIGDFAPEGFRPEQLTTALQLFAKGAKGGNIETETDKLKALGTISEYEAGELYRVAYFISAFEEAQVDLASEVFASEGEPRVTIQEAPAGIKPSDNQLPLGRGGAIFAPIKQVISAGVDFAKQKVKDFAVKAIKKGGKKLINKGAKIAAKAGVKAAEAAGIAIPVVGEVIAAVEIASLVKKGLSLVKRGVSKLLQTITGEKDTDKKMFALSLVALVVGLGIGGAAGAILASVGLFGAATSGASIVGGAAVGGGIAGAVQTIVYGTTTIASAYVAPFVIAIIAVPLLVAFFLFIINSGAYVVPRGPTLAVGAIENPFIDVEKTVVATNNRGNCDDPGDPDNPDSNIDCENSALSLTVEYTITVRAKRDTLTNITFDHDCFVSSRSSPPPSCSVPTPTPPSLISPVEGGEFTFTFTNTYDRSFADSIVANSFTVTADTPEVTRTTAAGSASVKIGDPPDECPSDWPVLPQFGLDRLLVLQGPHTSGGTHDRVEAIDIFTDPPYTNFTGHLIKATHTGIATEGNYGAYGRFVDVTSTCTTSSGPIEVTSRYSHLQTASVSTGQTVAKGQTVGTGGSSGTAHPHLHYEFRPDGSIPMDPPYLPKNVPDGCYDFGGFPCNVVIP